MPRVSQLNLEDTVLQENAKKKGFVPRTRAFGVREFDRMGRRLNEARRATRSRFDDKEPIPLVVEKTECPEGEKRKDLSPKLRVDARADPTKSDPRNHPAKARFKNRAGNFKYPVKRRNITGLVGSEIEYVEVPVDELKTPGESGQASILNTPGRSGQNTPGRASTPGRTNTARSGTSTARSGVHNWNADTRLNTTRSAVSSSVFTDSAIYMGNNKNRNFVMNGESTGKVDTMSVFGTGTILYGDAKSEPPRVRHDPHREAEYWGNWCRLRDWNGRASVDAANLEQLVSFDVNLRNYKDRSSPWSGKDFRKYSKIPQGQYTYVPGTYEDGRYVPGGMQRVASGADMITVDDRQYVATKQRQSREKICGKRRSLSSDGIRRAHGDQSSNRAIRNAYGDGYRNDEAYARSEGNGDNEDDGNIIEDDNTAIDAKDYVDKEGMHRGIEREGTHRAIDTDQTTDIEENVLFGAENENFAQKYEDVHKYSERTPRDYEGNHWSSAPPGSRQRRNSENKKRFVEAGDGNENSANDEIVVAKKPGRKKGLTADQVTNADAHLIQFLSGDNVTPDSLDTVVKRLTETCTRQSFPVLIRNLLSKMHFLAKYSSCVGLVWQCCQDLRLLGYVSEQTRTMLFSTERNRDMEFESDLQKKIFDSGEEKFGNSGDAQDRIKTLEVELSITRLEIEEKDREIDELKREVSRLERKVGSSYNLDAGTLRHGRLTPRFNGLPSVPVRGSAQYPLERNTPTDRIVALSSEVTNGCGHQSSRVQGPFQDRLQDPGILDDFQPRPLQRYFPYSPNVGFPERGTNDTYEMKVLTFDGMHKDEGNYFDPFDTCQPKTEGGKSSRYIFDGHNVVFRLKNDPNIGISEMSARIKKDMDSQIKYMTVALSSEVSNEEEESYGSLKSGDQPCGAVPGTNPTGAEMSQAAPDVNQNSFQDDNTSPHSPSTNSSKSPKVKSKAKYPAKRSPNVKAPKHNICEPREVQATSSEEVRLDVEPPDRTQTPSRAEAIRARADPVRPDHHQADEVPVEQTPKAKSPQHKVSHKEKSSTEAKHTPKKQTLQAKGPQPQNAVESPAQKTHPEVENACQNQNVLDEREKILNESLESRLSDESMAVPRDISTMSVPMAPESAGNNDLTSPVALLQHDDVIPVQRALQGLNAAQKEHLTLVIMRNPQMRSKLHLAQCLNELDVFDLAHLRSIPQPSLEEKNEIRRLLDEMPRECRDVLKHAVLGDSLVCNELLKVGNAVAPPGSPPKRNPNLVKQVQQNLHRIIKSITLVRDILHEAATLHNNGGQSPNAVKNDHIEHPLAIRTALIKILTRSHLSVSRLLWNNSEAQSKDIMEYLESVKELEGLLESDDEEFGHIVLSLLHIVDLCLSCVTEAIDYFQKKLIPVLSDAQVAHLRHALQPDPDEKLHIRQSLDSALTEDEFGAFAPTLLLGGANFDANVLETHKAAGDHQRELWDPSHEGTLLSAMGLLMYDLYVRFARAEGRMDRGTVFSGKYSSAKKPGLDYNAYAREAVKREQVFLQEAKEAQLVHEAEEARKATSKDKTTPRANTGPPQLNYSDPLGMTSSFENSRLDTSNSRLDTSTSKIEVDSSRNKVEPETARTVTPFTQREGVPAAVPHVKPHAEPVNQTVASVQKQVQIKSTKQRQFAQTPVQSPGQQTFAEQQPAQQPIKLQAHSIHTSSPAQPPQSTVCQMKSPQQQANQSFLRRPNFGNSPGQEKTILKSNLKKSSITQIVGNQSGVMQMPSETLKEEVHMSSGNPQGMVEISNGSHSDVMQMVQATQKQISRNKHPRDNSSRDEKLLDKSERLPDFIHKHTPHRGVMTPEESLSQRERSMSPLDDLAQNPMRFLAMDNMWKMNKHDTNVPTQIKKSPAGSPQQEKSPTESPQWGCYNQQGEKKGHYNPQQGSATQQARYGLQHGQQEQHAYYHQAHGHYGYQDDYGQYDDYGNALDAVDGNGNPIHQSHIPRREFISEPGQVFVKNRSEELFYTSDPLKVADEPESPSSDDRTPLWQRVMEKNQED